MESLSVPVQPAFVSYVESLVVRLGYLYPDVAWSFDADASILVAEYDKAVHSAEDLKKEASFQLYRERIHHDTLGIRRKIYEAI